jgi:trypsin
MLLGYTLLAFASAASLPANSSKIVNGVAVSSIDKYPWMTYLELKESNSFCGGVLLDSTTILTAAHCSFSTKPDQASATARRFDVTKTPQEEGAIVFTVDRIVVHPQYKPSDDNVAFDVAVWKVTVVSGDPANLPLGLVDLDDGSVSATGTRLTVAGWGLVQDGGSPAQTIREVSLPVLDDRTCRLFFPGLASSSFCAGFPNGGADSCQGDSGGPLFQPGSVNKIFGLVSYGIGCGSRPGMFCLNSFPV